MLEGLLAAHRRYDELSAQLSQPDAASDIGRYRALMKEYKELEPLSRQYLALAAAEEALAEAKELLYSHDAELSAMAAEQKAEAVAAPPVQTAVAADGVSPEVIAAITAAIAAVWESPNGFVVRHVKRVSNAPAWKRAGRDEQTYSRY